MSTNVDYGGALGEAIVLFVARILLAAVFFKEGFGKLTGLVPFSDYLMGVWVPVTYPLAIVVALVEFCGFVCVLVGLMR